MQDFTLLYEAIVQQAARDYFRASLRGDEEMKNDCLNFFKSKRYAVMTPLSPDVLISKLDREAELVLEAMNKLRAAGLKFRVQCAAQSITVFVNEKTHTWYSRKNINDFIKEITE